jgi:hypothetical protein
VGEKGEGMLEHVVFWEQGENSFHFVWILGGAGVEVVVSRRMKFRVMERCAIRMRMMMIWRGHIVVGCGVDWTGVSSVRCSLLSHCLILHEARNSSQFVSDRVCH